MTNVFAIAGSPSRGSRSAVALDYVAGGIEKRGARVGRLLIRDLPPAELVSGRPETAAFTSALSALEGAGGVIIATPAYKASYSGLLKIYLDTLPPSAFAGKVIFPIMTGGTLAHLLAVEYALKPVLSVLGARTIAGGVFVHDSQLVEGDGGAFEPSAELRTRLDKSIDEFALLLRLGGERR